MCRSGISHFILRLVLGLLAIMGSFNCLEAQDPTLSGLPFVRTFPTVEYRAGIQNWVITEDKRGLLYVANNFGLLEFDGTHWKTYPVKNGTKVRSVAIDNRGKIFVGSQADFGYFTPSPQGELTYVSLADSLDVKYRNFDEAWSVYVDGDIVYFCTFSRIYIYENGEFEIVESPSTLDLSFLVKERLMVQVADIGISTLQGGRLETVPGGNYFKGMSVSGMLPLNGTELLVSTFEHGVYVLFPDGTVDVWKPRLQDFLSEAQVNCMIRLKNGNYAVGTQNNGLLIIDVAGKMITQLTRGHGLENRTVLGLYEDDRENLWVAQNNGIAHVELGSPFSFIDEQKGLPGTGYAAFLDGDNFYLGTNTGLYLQNQIKGGDFSLVEHTRGQVYHVGKYGEEILLGHHRGTFSIGDHGRVISPEPGSWTFIVLKQNPNLMIGGTYFGLQLFENVNGKWRWKKKLKGFSESARVMAQDQDGNVWVTHGYKGAFKIRLSSDNENIEDVSFYDQGKGFPSQLLVNVFSVRNQLLFTSQRGVYVYDKKSDRFIHDKLFTPLFGHDMQLWFIQEDGIGNIYFTGAEHMGVLRKNAKGEYSVENTSFNSIRKYLNDDLINITILQNNDVLFGAKEGFIHFNPRKITMTPTDFRTLIRQVMVTSPRDSVVFHGNYFNNGVVGHEQAKGEKLNLTYDNNSVHFSFAATSYQGNSERVFQYYLENFDHAWSDWSGTTQKEYTNLKEGEYVFMVRARDMNGNVSTPTRFSFYISPPWYRSIIAYGIYAAGIVGLLFVGFSVLDRKYQREQRLLEEKQQQELEQKEEELEKLSVQSQEEINRLHREKLESEIRHMNTELATATMHLLNKNEFMTGIKTHLTQLMKRDANEANKRELLQITKDIETNISDDADWEHFQFHFDRVHGDFTLRFKAAFPALTPQEIKLSAYLRMNLTTKEIAQLLNISVRGVEISRYRLRKKLQLDRQQNLQDYILNF